MIEHNKQVAEELSKLLAESYTLYLKTHKYHWNVTGPMFHSLHLLFEQQYTELAEAVDTIAERIRALGWKAPGSYAEFAKLARVCSRAGSLPGSPLGPLTPARPSSDKVKISLRVKKLNLIRAYLCDNWY